MITDLITNFGYLGVFLVAFLENFFPPIPSELIFPFIGFVAGRGELNLPLAILAGVLGATLGALFWWALGYLLGRARVFNLVNRHGRLFRLNSHDLKRAEEWFSRYEDSAVFFGRFIPLVRTLISVPAGFVRMPLFRFLGYSAAGILFWVSALTIGGFILGERWEEIVPWVQNYELVFGIIVLVIVAAFLAKFLKFF